jgi:uncharacterized membrane protein YphA (DoxX/SURF4 family)
MLLLVPSSPLWEAQTVLILVAACVCFGFWTPVMSALEAAAELLMVLSRPVNYESHVLLALVAISLAFLGPGAWSVDALLFGRKRIAI